jgi:hypothetical protein
MALSNDPHHDRLQQQGDRRHGAPSGLSRLFMPKGHGTIRALATSTRPTQPYVAAPERQIATPPRASVSSLAWNSRLTPARATALLISSGISRRHPSRARSTCALDESRDWRHAAGGSACPAAGNDELFTNAEGVGLAFPQDLKTAT